MIRAPVRVFDAALTLKTELDNYTSLYFTRAWYGIGDFNLIMPRDALHADELQRGRIIMVCAKPRPAGSEYITEGGLPITDDGMMLAAKGAASSAAYYADSFGIITEITRSVDDRGTETISASGYELRHIFTWRRVLPEQGNARWEHTGAVETILKNLVYAQAGAGADAARQFPLLTVATDLELGDSYLISARYSALSEEVEQAAWATNAGPRIYLDLASRLFVFDVAFGVDRTALQTINGRAIFSPEWDTLETADVTESDIEYRNHALVGGQGVGAARVIVPVFSGTEPEGFARRELWVDARDLSDTDDLAVRGAAKLAELAAEDYLEATILPFSPLEYRVDYDIGDLCTISALGETVDARISEAQESWDESGYSLALTFGKPYPEAQIIAARNDDATAATLTATEQ